MKKNLIFFMGVLFSISMYSQTGATCATAKLFDTTSVNGMPAQTQVQQSQWYKFTSLNTQVDISIFAFKGYIDEINSVKLWGGTCAGLSLIGSDTISGATDSMLTINATSITTGQVYYLQFGKSNSTDTAKFSVDLFFLLPPPSCTSCAIAPVVCELVCNGNFEYSTVVPTIQDQMSLACPWVKANLETPDYFKGAALPGGFSVPSNYVGNQNDFIGGNAAYAGIVARWPVYPLGGSVGNEKEFIYQKLKDPLVACETYAVQMRVSLSDKSRHAVNFLGMYLSIPDPYAGTLTSIPYIPAQTISSGSTFITNTSGWTTISALYTAVGGESYIAVGCFGGGLMGVTPSAVVAGTEGHVAYYYIDGVSVQHVFSIAANASPSVICLGGSSTLTASGPCNSTGIGYAWLPAGTGSGPIVTVNPTSTTVYTVIATDANGCTAMASTTVTVNPIPTVSAISNVVTCSGATVPA